MQQETVLRLDETINQAQEYLFSAQRVDGSWCDHLPSSAVSTGAALLALHSTGDPRYASILAEGAAWLRATQREDGGWGDGIVDPSNINGTAIGTSALQVVDPEGSREAVARGSKLIAQMGGNEILEDKSRCTLGILCRTWLADAGIYDPSRLGRIPIELVLLPNGLQRRVCFTLPGVLSWGMMHARTRPPGWLRRQLYKLAEPRALDWLERVQAYEQYQGGYEESPLMSGVVAYALQRAGVGQEIAERLRRYLVNTRRSNGSWSINRDLEFSASMFVLMGLIASGAGESERLKPTVEWVRRSQRQEPFFPTGCPAGGWGWSLPSGWPDTDDTSSALMVLPGLGVAVGDEQLEKGARWLEAMQNPEGSWACFMRGARLSLDHACPVFTAHAMIGLHIGAGHGPVHKTIAQACRYLKKVQRPDGSIHALWYRNYTSGTASVLEAYGILGLSADPVAQRCRAWLCANQNSDGSWGGQRGDAGTVEETSWALSALVACGTPANDPQLHSAARWLMDRQLPDGGWEPSMIGVYFVSLMYSSDHLANGYALQALGRYREHCAASLQVEPRHTTTTMVTADYASI